MTTVEELEKVIKESGEILEKNIDFVKLRDFYEEMQELGVAKRPQYDLPPVDTIGRRLYEIQHRADAELLNQ